MECCMNCRFYVEDYGYWFCRKENDDEETDVKTYRCEEYKKDEF